MDSISECQFWKSIQIWMKNPHVVNRRLCGASTVVIWKSTSSSVSYNAILTNLNSIKYSFLLEKSENEVLSHITLPKDGFNKISADDFDAEFNESPNNDRNATFYIILQKLLPRTSKYRNTYQVILINTYECTASFISVSECDERYNLCPEFNYNIKFSSGRIILEIPSEFDSSPSAIWLKNELMPRIHKWTEIESNNDSIIPRGSLNSISLNDYNSLYQKLKITYGKKFVEIWPENTDPSKFVYEDVAIATYLLLLWEKERIESGGTDKQSFVDLGCGNGLLVYILTSEGHRGRGIDIRKRMIWDLYPPYVKLDVETIVPSDRSLYPDSDWLIGNHSDELTPWIPVMAAKSSYRCNFFLLPCCAYEFNGAKYQRKNSSKSQYNEYMEYVKSICDECGIVTRIDRLKIPSTKRVCLIGTTRTYNEHDRDNHLDSLQQFINRNNSIQGEDNWLSDFKPREAVEKVKNCTKINRNIVEAIVELVSSHLLSERNYIDRWNAGKCIPLGEIVNIIPDDLLNGLKNECGGLQTLLKNNHQIFEVASGKVKFRFPKRKSEFLNKRKPRDKPIKPRSCWFYKNHPDKCPLSANECSYLHD